MKDRAIREDHILREQAKQLYKLAPLGFVATIMNSVMVYFVMREVIPSGPLILWLATLLALIAVRIALVSWFNRTFRHDMNPAVWLRRFTFSLFLAGISWGAIGLFPFTFSIAHQVFIAFVLGGMAAGASSTFSAVKHGFAAFSAPTLLPLAVHFMVIDDPFHHAMALMILLFVVLLWKISQHNYWVNRSSLSLRFENREIIETLRESKEALEVLNVQLLSEIKAKEDAEALLRAHRDDLARTVQERTVDLMAANEQLKSEIEERKQVEVVLKEAQEKLVAAKDAAEAGSRAKSEFLANMSHEMRTPLAGALGMIRLVLDMEISAEERELLGMARQSTESLLRIISDVLDFSKIEAGAMTFEHKPILVSEVVRTAVEVVHIGALEKGLQLEWEVDPGVEEIIGDAGRLRQVLVNLVGNAVKFTESGGIRLTVSDFVDPDAAGVRFALFTVRDTGVGIDGEHLDHIFGRFTQVDSSLTRRHGGTGLGLALSREIVEKLGGRLWAESAPGAGSTFYFTLPCR